MPDESRQNWMMRCPRCHLERPRCDWGMNPRQGTLQCAHCAYQGYDIMPEYIDAETGAYIRPVRVGPDHLAYRG